MTVIDISTYQGTVDFAQVKASGVGRVIAKMGGGDAGQYLDSWWLSNRDAIRGAGLALGSYYFNGPAVSPTAAADFHFVNIDHRPGDLVIIDVEGGSIAWTPAQVLSWVQRMLSHGVPISDIGVYMSASVTFAEDWSQVAATGAFLWVASYGSNTGTPGPTPSVAHWPSWLLWQYTSNGTVPGINGRVDMSLVAPGFTDTTLTPLNNMEEPVPYIIDGGKTQNRKAIALASWGNGWHVLTGDEWNLIATQIVLPDYGTWPKIFPVNDASWDMLASIFSQPITAPPAPITTSAPSTADIVAAIQPLLAAVGTSLDSVNANVLAIPRYNITKE